MLCAVRSKALGTDEVGSKIDGKVKTPRSRRAQHVQGTNTTRKRLKGYTWIVTELMQDLIWAIRGWVANPVPVHRSMDGPERRFWTVIMRNVLSYS